MPIITQLHDYYFPPSGRAWPIVILADGLYTRAHAISPDKMVFQIITHVDRATDRLKCVFSAACRGRGWNIRSAVRGSIHQTLSLCVCVCLCVSVCLNEGDAQIKTSFAYPRWRRAVRRAPGWRRSRRLYCIWRARIRTPRLLVGCWWRRQRQHYAV